MTALRLDKAWWRWLDADAAQHGAAPIMTTGIAIFLRLMPFLAVLWAAGCATSPMGKGPPPGDAADVAALTREIRALGPDVDPEEAERAARVAYRHTYQLAQEYQITDPPIIHNTKVNLGLRPRGLCWHWAKDIEDRLKQEDFTTLDLHRAVANADNPFRLEHSTTIVSRRGDNFRQGVVLDPWRKGGVLFWARTDADTDYDWQSRDAVLVKKLGYNPALSLSEG